MDKKRIRVLIVDDDQLVRMSLKIIIGADPELEVVGCGGSGDEAVQLFDGYRPDVLLLDIRMQPTDGLAAGERTLARHPEARLLYLTTFTDDEYRFGPCAWGPAAICSSRIMRASRRRSAVAAGQHVFGDLIMARIPVLIGGRLPDLSGYDYPRPRTRPASWSPKALTIVRSPSG
jgi:DNA-binding NarL/FixJ family response regulator